MDMKPPGPRRRALFTPLPFDSGRFVLLEEIGRGAAGTVYRARDNGFEVPRSVCIKRLTQPLSNDLARALREEARLLSSVRHSNVVTLLGIGEEAGGPFLVLEYIDGLNLSALGRGLEKAREHSAAASPHAGFLPDPLAVHVACAMLRGLGALSRALPGFVHRDITPHNVLVSTEGEVKLADFGVALQRGQHGDDPKRVNGKAGYMAPEQIRGDTLDPRADLFAVGVTLYELLARRRPAQGEAGSVGELRRVVGGNLEPIAVHRPHLPTSLHRAVGCLLAPAPDARFSSADAALRALAPHGAGEIGSLRMASLVDAVRNHAHRLAAVDDELHLPSERNATRHV